MIRVNQNSTIAADPFSMSEIVVNLRSGYQMASHCCICGEPNSKSSPIETHHINHVRKGKASGFRQLMKNQNRFSLSENFVNKYRRRKAPFGFNGLGELVYNRTYSRLKDDGKNG